MHTYLRRGRWHAAFSILEIVIGLVLVGVLIALTTFGFQAVHNYFRDSATSNRLLQIARAAAGTAAAAGSGAVTFQPDLTEFITAAADATPLALAAQPALAAGMTVTRDPSTGPSVLSVEIGTDGSQAGLALRSVTGRCSYAKVVGTRAEAGPAKDRGATGCTGAAALAAASLDDTTNPGPTPPSTPAPDPTTSAPAAPDLIPAALSSNVLWLRGADLTGPTASSWVDRSGRKNRMTAFGAPPAVIEGATPTGGKALSFTSGSPLVSRSSLGLTDQSLEATAKDVYGAGYEAVYAVDGNASTAWVCRTAAPTWLALRAVDGPLVLTSYSITPRGGWPSHAPRAWTLEGSNDESAWTTLDTRTGVTWPNGAAQNFTASNITSYEFYRLNISSGGQDPGTCDIGEISLNGAANTAVPYAGELWMVAKIDVGNTSPATKFSTGGGQSSHFPWADGVVYETFGLRGGRAGFSPGADISQWTLYRVSSDGTSWRAYVNGAQRSSATNEPVNWTPTVAIGGDTNGATFRGQIAEVLVRRTVSTAAEEKQLIEYFNTEHGLTVPIP